MLSLRARHSLGGGIGVGLALVGVFLAGCAGPPADEPLPTDGPNQVVLKVPGMT